MSPKTPQRGASAFTPNWARTLVDPQAFSDEQHRLASVWTFLGFTSDLAKDGDWFRASLATRSVFVQRFDATLKGFENVCAHRFYPLRTGDKGHGPIVCGFHGWRYVNDGCAIGIPMCQEQFGTVSRALGARLTPVEIATCGALIFGRFASEGPRESLSEFLGTGFPILEALSRSGGPSPQAISTPVAANWKLNLQITLDDYHGVAVHPTTIGRNGYMHRADVSYLRFGLHSALLVTKEPQALEKMAEACANGSFRPSHYCIFQILPNLVVSLFHSGGAFFHCCIQQYVPVAHDRSVQRVSIHPVAFPAEHPWPIRWTRPLSDPIRRRLIWRTVRRIMREDHQACERLQLVAHQVHRAPLLSVLEERIGWFEESYARLMAGHDDAVGTSSTVSDEA
ncbi:Rieske 2Fe-2S domain-containing protein [Reyranella sp. MMS21-HV4-11]|uniref:Rieske 2Fe-2S domain-containing protein n=1 Tax=Reyranella humidisoli TaxID=2849149 RepID=A0ABS6ING5_9HYPH|nr:Rieske 2Fe-2S domain-containing protein [Reyranella sp. MMS21-HV4-11]MBU8874725.1 Rieske 2Fe-2S domain-containing protein [Reyranella sp. MMS21-HV4-11]